MSVPIKDFDFGTVGLLIDEAHSRAALFVLTEPDDVSEVWLIALAELGLHHPEAVLDSEPEYEDGVEVFTATWPLGS